MKRLAAVFGRLSLVIILCGVFTSASADQRQDRIKMEADYILACQYMVSGDAYGAINNIHGNPTWVVPRENAMAILGLIVASEALGDNTYLNRAQVAADYLLRVQDSTDGGWYDQYEYAAVKQYSKSPTQTAEVMIAFHKLGYAAERYAAMKKGARFLMECQKPKNKRGNNDGLLGGGKNALGEYQHWRWTSDNSYAYQALKAAQDWASTQGHTAFASQCAQAAKHIITGIDRYLYCPPVWYAAIDEHGTPQGNPDLPPRYKNKPHWIRYAPQMLDLPAKGVGSPAVGKWIRKAFQQADGSCVGWVMDAGLLRKRAYPGLSFQAALCWYDLSWNVYAEDALTWAENSGLWHTTADLNGVTGGWVDWIEVTPDPGLEAAWWLRFIDTSFYTIAALSGGYDFTTYTDIQHALKVANISINTARGRVSP